MLVNAYKVKHDPASLRLLQSIKGIIFMGTPHKGTRFTTLAKIWSLAGFWEGSSTTFLDLLDFRSVVNQQLHDDFLQALPDGFSIRDVLCIHETAPETVFGFPFAVVAAHKPWFETSLTIRTGSGRQLSSHCGIAKVKF